MHLIRAYENEEKRQQYKPKPWYKIIDKIPSSPGHFHTFENITCVYGYGLIKLLNSSLQTRCPAAFPFVYRYHEN